MLKVLVLYYSQTGRTQEALEVFLRPLRARSDLSLDIRRVEPVVPYPYPWPIHVVVPLFPEVVHEVPIALRPLQLEPPYALIILACQVWFLSCSLPITALLKQSQATVFADTPVITLLTYRKAWAQGQACLERQVAAVGGRLSGRLVLRALDRQPFPLFKAMRYHRTSQNTKDWRFAEEDLADVEAMGKELVEDLEQKLTTLRTDPRAGPDRQLFKERSAVFLPPEERREPLTQEEHLISQFEGAQKQKYLEWGAFIRHHSQPQTVMRHLLIAGSLPFFAPRIYYRLPLEILKRWISPAVQDREKTGTARPLG